MSRPPATLAQLRDLVEELRADAAVESQSTAAVLHRLDQIAKRQRLSDRCLRVMLRILRHLHDAMARRKVRDAARTNR